MGIKHSELNLRRWAAVSPAERSAKMSELVAKRWAKTPPKARTKFAAKLFRGRLAKRPYLRNREYVLGRQRLLAKRVKKAKEKKS